MIVAQGIHKVYCNGGKELPVLKGIDLKIEKGSFCAFVGPSGAGKSTLLHILGGLDSPSRGSVLLEGQDIYRLSDAALCRFRNSRIGFVFQFYHLLPEFSVMENVLMPSLIGQGSPVSMGAMRERALALLDTVGLSARVSYVPSQLSGGEKQRVAIVRALMNEPHFLLCDEPTGNLDSKAGNEIFALLRTINAEKRTTVVLVTHNMELAHQADSVYKLKDGVVVQ